ncbi:MAG TPA: hypothetical protein VF058_11530 [Actinomycetota bacterium]
MSLWQWLLLFAAGAVVLVWAGSVLARSGDEIATRTRLGGLFVGTLLMAAATSLPEIVTVVAAAATEAVDLAVGSIFGSSMGNMAILAVIDLVHRKHVWPAVELGHARVGTLAIALTSLAVLGVVTPRGPMLGWVGIDTILILLAWIAAMAWMRRSRHGRFADYPAPTEWGEAESPRGELRSAVVRFSLASLAVLLAGPVVAIAGDGIAETSGLSATFVGVLFVAVATSLPELVASLGALRIGAYDLAVGNLFGSNAFNMIVLVFADAAYTGGPLLTGAGASQVAAGVGAIGLMAVALAAIVHGEETRISRLEPDALVLLIFYLGSLYAVWATS